MKKSTIIILSLLMFSGVFSNSLNLTERTQQWSEKNPTSLPQWMTPEEELKKDEIGRDFVETDPPIGPVRNIAEFEKMEGVLVRYPFGISTSIIAEMSENAIVTTIVTGQSQENTVTSQYQSAGVNLNNCNFLYAPSDSYWTRDYGPWYVVNGNDEVSIVNFVYNRPRPNDNDIPIEVADFLDVPLYGMDLTTAGGNYMTDGMGIASSSDLIWSENSDSPEQINQMVEDYLGVHTYHVIPDPNNTYIDHIDCWGKFLDVDKVMIREVASNHAQYDEIEATADYYANQLSSYGTPFEVYRVYTPQDQPYTNSLILNDKVIVPITGSSYDDDAIASYQEAMPGYEVLGFTGSWESTDALHCRAKGIADRDMLHISHIPVFPNVSPDTDYTITAEFIPYSGAELLGSPQLHYKINNGNFTTISMNYESNDTYLALIPGQPLGTEVAYYITASDVNGNSSNHPFIGEPDPHTFSVGGASINIDVTEINSSALIGNITTNQFEISNIGNELLEFDISYSATGRQDYSYSVPNSPSSSSWNSNTFSEVGWTNVSVPDAGLIGNVSISYTWDTDSWAYEGAFYIKSPSGTQIPIASGQNDGTYTINKDAFNDEQMNGSWQIWIEDSYGDGGHQATNITLTITTLSAEEMWMTVEPISGAITPGGNETISVTCDASEILEGVYNGVINVTSNDWNNQNITIPVNFTVNEETPTNLSIALEEGWNWFSINLENNEMSLNYVLENIGASGEMIKNQNSFSMYYDGFGWYSGNGLDEIDVESMFMIKTVADCNISFDGYPVDYLNTPIPLTIEWNWISYLPQIQNGINEALESIQSYGVFIKNQSSFANYYEEFGWYSGNGLDYMTPADGYMLQMALGTELVYTIPSYIAKIEDTEETKELHWSVNPHQFEYNMAITVELDKSTQLAVFVDDEVRGVTESTYFPLTDSYTANLMAYGNDGEELSFRVYQSETDTEIEVLDNITFEINGIVGNDIEPILLKLLTTPEEYSLLQNYPNPFNPSTTISYTIPLEEANCNASLQIFNINGQLVETLVDGNVDAGYHSVVWNADNFASGVYLVKFIANGFTQTQKMLLMK
ncbi:MAG: agmatine deiminase family protein [Candidatus Marinimicrobia bacterium]|nr:agmatine deiminase family protein [Candidatus Neomarinimicrobiota bacterium]MBL7109764.1 agmatine deiminase family protein [Candidatus Neomarinimicrobiota bacterium]